MHRRKFAQNLAGAGCASVLGNALASPLAAAAQSIGDFTNLWEYRRNLTDCDRCALGAPRWVTSTREALHPIAPERIVVLDEQLLSQLRGAHHPLKRRLRTCYTDRDGRHRKIGTDRISDTKLDVIVGLMERLTQHYRSPDLMGRWAQVLFGREVLATLGLLNGLYLLHDFQPLNTPVRTDNFGVDWWPVLMPGGVDLDNLDGKPAYLMLGQVMERRDRVGDYVRVMCNMSAAANGVIATEPAASSARRLASVARVDAARAMNFALARTLAVYGRLLREREREYKQRQERERRARRQ